MSGAMGRGSKLSFEASPLDTGNAEVDLDWPKVFWGGRVSGWAAGASTKEGPEECKLDAESLGWPVVKALNITAKK